MTEIQHAATARETAWVWGHLSTTCPRHPHELAPTCQELSEWIERTAAFVAAAEV